MIATSVERLRELERDVEWERETADIQRAIASRLDADMRSMVSELRTLRQQILSFRMATADLVTSHPCEHTAPDPYACATCYARRLLETTR